jgi:hypothetical protein
MQHNFQNDSWSHVLTYCAFRFNFLSTVTKSKFEFETTVLLLVYYRYNLPSIAILNPLYVVGE